MDMNGILRLLKTEKMRHLIVGGLVTLVNLVCFHLLVDILHWNVTLSNVISVLLAILFAFVANKYMVFRSSTSTVRDFMIELMKFSSGRMITMVIEVGGVYILHDVMKIAAMPSKIATQVIVVVLNYFISKYFVFRK